MKKFFTKGRIALLVIFSVLIVDQVIKVVVKTQMYWHQSENVIKWIYEKFGIVDAEPPTWFYIYFTENNGMAQRGISCIVCQRFINLNCQLTRWSKDKSTNLTWSTFLLRCGVGKQLFYDRYGKCRRFTGSGLSQS